MANQNKIKDIWKRKDDYITSRLDWLARKVNRAQDDLFKLLMGDYIGNFSVDEEGRLKSNAKNMRQAIVLDRIFDELAVKSLVDINTRFGEDMLKLTPMSGKYYEAMGTPKDTVENIAEKTGFIDTAIGLKDGKIVKGSYLDTLTRMPEARQELKDYITSSVANKKTFKEFVRGLKRLVLGASPGLLDRYYNQNAFDTFNQTDAAVNKKYADELDLTWFVYAGSLIDTSRAFCVKRAGKTFNTKETEKWKCDPTLIGKPKGVKCDQKYNPLIERGRWNCRHTIRYISADLACNNGRQEACEDQIPIQVSEQSTSGFVKAKNIKQAEKYAVDNGITKKVDYSLLSVEEANTINKTLTGYKNKYGITLESINTAEGNVFSALADAQMIMQEGRITFNVKSIRSGFKTRVSNIKKIEKRINTLEADLKQARDLGWDDDVINLKAKIKKLNIQLDNTPEFYSFSESAKSYNQYLKYVTDHEYTHILQGHDPILHGKTRLEIANYYHETISNTKLFNKYYTDYASVDWEEFWAEASAMYKNGKLKDEKMIRLLKKIDSDAEKFVR